MALHPISLPCTLALPPTSHWDATTPSPCWAPHFMTQERFMFSNPTPISPRLSSTAMMSDDILSARTPPFHCACIITRHCMKGGSRRTLGGLSGKRTPSKDLWQVLNGSFVQPCCRVSPHTLWMPMTRTAPLSLPHSVTYGSEGISNSL